MPSVLWMLNTCHIKPLVRSACYYMGETVYIHMYTILYVGIFYVTDIPTTDSGCLWGDLVQVQEKVHVHTITHHRKGNILSCFWLGLGNVSHG